MCPRETVQQNRDPLRWLFCRLPSRMIYERPFSKFTQINPMIKGVMTWAKVTSHVCEDSEAYHEQMGPIPSSNGILDIALFNAHT